MLFRLGPYQVSVSALFVTQLLPLLVPTLYLMPRWSEASPQEIRILSALLMLPSCWVTSAFTLTLLYSSPPLLPSSSVQNLENHPRGWPGGLRGP